MAVNSDLNGAGDWLIFPLFFQPWTSRFQTLYTHLCLPQCLGQMLDQAPAYGLPQGRGHLMSSSAPCCLPVNDCQLRWCRVFGFVLTARTTALGACLSHGICSLF